MAREPETVYIYGGLQRTQEESQPSTSAKSNISMLSENFTAPVTSASSACPALQELGMGVEN